MALDRIALLTRRLEKDPEDSFTRYALGMEHARKGEHDRALALYREVIERDAGYVPAYQMAGQLEVERGEPEAARPWLEKGIEAARAAGNQKAVNEMMDLVDELDLL